METGEWTPVWTENQASPGKIQVEMMAKKKLQFVGRDFVVCHFH